MSSGEKERQARIMILDICVTIVFMIIAAMLVRGFKIINPGAAMTTSIVLGQALLYIGIIVCIIGLIKKKGMVVRYSIESVIWGVLILFLYYSFFRQKIMPNFGFIYYYSLLILGVLYIIISIAYTVIKVRK